MMRWRTGDDVALHSERLNRQAFERLAQAMQAPIKPLALVGAGVSVRAGFPTWGELLKRLHESAMEHRPMTPKVAANLLNQADMLWRAEEYREHLGETEYHELLRELFRDKDAGAALDPVLLDLVGLPFGHVLTTNYDNVLELAHQRAGLPAYQAVEWTDARALRDFLVNIGVGPRRYVYLHGRATRPETVVLTDRDYVERYARSVDAHRKLFALFTTQRLVFVGFSLSDPELTALLREVHVALGPGEPRHFALLALKEEEEDTLERRRLRQKYGIEPIFYPFSRDHAALGPMLAALKAGLTESGEAWRQEGAAGAAQAPAQKPVPPPPGSSMPDHVPPPTPPSEESAANRRGPGALPSPQPANLESLLTPLSFSASDEPQAPAKSGAFTPAPSARPRSAPASEAGPATPRGTEGDRLEYLGATNDDVEDKSKTEQADVAHTASEEPSTGGAHANPEDPQKGRWGGLAARDDFQLSATVTLTPALGWYEVELRVQQAAERKRITRGLVTFYLHPTLNPSVQRLPLIQGAAMLRLRCYGAFTVGAEVAPEYGTRTQLELDLAELPDAPQEFRES